MRLRRSPARTVRSARTFGDDDAFCDAQNRQKFHGLADFLERAVEYRHVETVAAMSARPPSRSFWSTGTPFQGSRGCLSVFFDAHARDVLVPGASR